MRAIAILLGRTVTLVAVLLGAVANPRPALAHGGAVQLGVGPDGAGGLAVLASYVDDGHPVQGLTLAATATAGSVHVGPLTLRPAGEGEGFYILSPGALPSGHWTVTVTGTADRQVRAATTTLDVKAPGATPSPPGVPPAAVGPPKSAEQGATRAGRTSRIALVVGGLAALTLLGGLSLLVARRRGSFGLTGEPRRAAPRSGQLNGRSR
jgi:hypothetical protein